jgi:hypothetical protein
MNQMKEILAKYINQTAVRAVEMEEENAAIVLYILTEMEASPPHQRPSFC